MARLKRVITFWEALAIDIGAIIGAGIFVISGLAAGIAGPSVLVSIVIGAIISIFTGLSFASLAHVYSTEGGSYQFSKKLLGQYAGTLSGLIWIIGGIIAGAAMSLSFGGYFLSIFSINYSPVIVAAALVIILGIVNYAGVKDSADLSVILTIIKLIVLALFIIVGVFYIKPSNYVPFTPNGIDSIFVGTAFIFFAYTGFARAATLGEEVEKPKKVLPRVILLSILISAIIYILVMFALIGMVKYSTVSVSSSPLSTAIIDATHNQTLGLIIAIGAMFATINVTLAMILGLSRMIFAMARDRILPGAFSKLSNRSTPSYAIFFSVGLMIVAIVAVSFKEIVAISNSAILVSYAIVNFAAFTLMKKKEKALKNTLYGSPYFKVIPVLGLFSSLALLFFLTRLSIEVTGALVVLISIYYLMLNKYIRKGR